MSKELISDGNDFVVEQVDRQYGGLRKKIIQGLGADGSLVLGDDSSGTAPFKIAKDGTVSIAGTATASAISGAVAIAANSVLTAAAGTGALDLSLATGVTKTTTGLNTIGGDLLMAVGKVVGFGAPQALSGPGAVNVTTLVTLYTSTGSGDALTLADGTRLGQLKIVQHIVDGGSAVITPTHKSGFTTLTLTAVYDAGVMIWDGSNWRPVLATGSAAFA